MSPHWRGKKNQNLSEHSFSNCIDSSNYLLAIVKEKENKENGKLYILYIKSLNPFACLFFIKFNFFEYKTCKVAKRASRKMLQAVFWHFKD